MRRIITLVYLVVGIVVASAQGYLGDINGLGDALNLLLAILLWPLLLVGVDFNIRIGDGDNGGRNRNRALILAGPALTQLRVAVARRVAGPGRIGEGPQTR